MGAHRACDAANARLSYVSMPAALRARPPQSVQLPHLAMPRQARAARSSVRRVELQPATRRYGAGGQLGFASADRCRYHLVPLPAAPARGRPLVPASAPLPAIPGGSMGSAPEVPATSVAWVPARGSAVPIMPVPAVGTAASVPAAPSAAVPALAERTVPVIGQAHMPYVLLGVHVIRPDSDPAQMHWACVLGVQGVVGLMLELGVCAAQPSASTILAIPIQPTRITVLSGFLETSRATDSTFPAHLRAVTRIFLLVSAGAKSAHHSEKCY
jgi:hypothetical protein